MAQDSAQTALADSPRLDLPAHSTPAFSSSLLAILTGQVASGVVVLLTEVCYSRFLGPATRGMISICLMSVAFAVLIGAAGGEGSIVFWSSKEKGNHARWFPAVFLWGVLGCILASAAWYVAYWRIQFTFLRGITTGAAWLVLANIPAAILFSYGMALLTGAEMFSLRSANAVARQLAAILAFLLFLVIFGRTAEGALWGTLIGCLAGSFLTLFLLRARLRGFWRIRSAKSNLIPTLTYGLRGQIGNLATFFTYRLDIFIINYFLPLSQLGYYALGVTISEALWQIPTAVGSALFPRTARTQVDDATQFTCFAMRQVFLVTCMCGILIAACSPLFVPFVFGAAFKPSIPVILLLLPGTMALCLAKVGCSDLAGRGKNGYSSIFAITCLVLTVFLDWILIPRVGILGAALASSIAYFLDSVLVLIAVRYELRVTWKDMLVPTKQDFANYKSAWQRLTTRFPSIRKNRTAFMPTLSSSKGD